MHIQFRFQYEQFVSTNTDQNKIIKHHIFNWLILNFLLCFIFAEPSYILFCILCLNINTITITNIGIKTVEMIGPTCCNSYVPRAGYMAGLNCQILPGKKCRHSSLLKIHQYKQKYSWNFEFSKYNEKKKLEN